MTKTYFVRCINHETTTQSETYLQEHGLYNVTLNDKFINMSLLQKKHRQVIGRTAPLLYQPMTLPLKTFSMRFILTHTV